MIFYKYIQFEIKNKKDNKRTKFKQKNAEALKKCRQILEFYSMNEKGKYFLGNLRYFREIRFFREGVWKNDKERKG
ncbi:hypothetical protein [Anaerotignum sp.]|uniref:hypothetical protein n=1 Tax=Anaerotignum sp. TaxID=2039241 RepID=UPI0028ADAA89|nr:hypothetical protein [Anaerotignum sp.]